MTTDREHGWEVIVPLSSPSQRESVRLTEAPALRLTGRPARRGAVATHRRRARKSCREPALCRHKLNPSSRTAIVIRVGLVSRSIRTRGLSRA